MTPDQIAVLRATPAANENTAPLFRIAERAGMEPPTVAARLMTLRDMGLVELHRVGYQSDWSRTPTGDREARRHGR
jgi:DNA-binding transcriptional ArsR family regulator